ncbi:MAG: 1-deoxy-D-xylulose-5-phosphate synthase [Candidatus Rokubacteria bacterium]|nr:1-deoxy-D-xylulose-5-phosphate synthase [Candidatus Rokubacteria bacterium]
MRGAFATALIELAAADPRILLLTGDLGFMVLEPFAERFPERFFNAGVAEQNMIGLATGLARSGFIPFVYSIATFASMRPYEFIRNGPILHRLPVRIVGVGAGFEYGHAGPSHHGLEDIGIMRVQPGLTLIAPADHRQTRTALQKTWDLPGPIYLSLGKDDRTIVPGLDGRFELGRADLVHDGTDVLMLATGAIASEAVAAADALARHGVACAVMVVASLNPAPTDDLLGVLERFSVALTVEAHYVVGGLGSLVSETIAEHGLRCRLVRCGARTAPDGRSGSNAALSRAHGLSRDALVRTVLAALATVTV